MRTLQTRSGARRLISALLFLLLSLTCLHVNAAERHTLWAIKGEYNTLYLLGSLHLLRASETLPDAFDAAYRDAERLIMEIDMDDLDLTAVQQLTLQLGMLPPDATLTAALGAEGATKLNAYTAKLGVPTAMLDRFQPWFAAMTLTQVHLLKLGFDPQSGVEQRFVARATADKKEISGLETIEEQLRLLADLPSKLQVSFLLQSIAEAEQMESEIEAMLAAWRTGDSAGLEKIMASGLKEYPELYRPLTVDRNQKWLGRLEQLLKDPALKGQDHLVIVGALHLVGKDGVVDLLGRKGYRVEQR